MLPIHWVFVRHGQSEGNLANDRSRAGDHSSFDEAFLKRYSAEFKLTDLGIKQAEAAGHWLQKNISFPFARYYVSPYIRAIETAGKLGLPNASWSVPKIMIRERDRGEVDVKSQEQLQNFYQDTLELKDIQGMFYRFPGGESIADTVLRSYIFFQTTTRESPTKSIISVSHGEVMWANRFVLEGMTLERYYDLERSKDPFDKIHNCQIIHYTRQNPDNPEDISHRYNWVRSICPWNIELSFNKWRKIPHKRYSNEDLLELAAKYPRLIDE